MELEFDKEMDAILRRARGDSGVSVTTAHLDADTIAAFVENALPDKAKRSSAEHFADCDQCRKQLSFAMSMNTEVEKSEASSVAVPIADAAIPWYSKLFRTPNLALGMGALVVAFSGIIGYLVIQNKSAVNRSDIAANYSKPMSSEPAPGAVAANSASDANKPVAPGSNINPAAPAVSPANGSVPTALQPEASEPSSVTGRVDQPTVATKGGDADFSGGVPADEEKNELKAAGTQPAPQPKGGQPDETRDEKQAISKSVTEDVTATDRNRTTDDRLSREGPYSPKKKDSGPTRAGPSVTQQQSNANIYNQTQIRSVGGKSFDNRGGVWYDTSYNGQPMIRVTRGSEEYKKLDGSVKRAAENLGGTVVVVWKAKAYRIQ